MQNTKTTKPKFGEGDAITIFLTRDQANTLSRHGFAIRNILAKDIHLHEKACEVAHD